MNLQDLIRKNNKAKVMKRLAILYPEQKKNIKGYKLVWDDLLTKRKRKPDIELVLREEEEDGESWVDVSGWKSGDEHWGLDFTSRSEWLGMEIHHNTLSAYYEEDIIVHALWEMTWHGFNGKEVTNMKRMIMGRVESIKKELDA